MGEVKNLISHEAIYKIKELATDSGIAIFATNLRSLPISARPMSTRDVDDEGNLWFLSKSGSDKNNDILNDSRVQLFYSNKSSSEYLSFYGHAEIITDRNRIQKLWTPIAKAWFTEGKDDPTITIIKVMPEEAYYWDTKEGKVVSLLKIAFGALTGKPMDGGVEGKIKI